jgi:hypothetical protein
MAVGTKDSLEMECKAVQAYFIGKAVINNIKEIGTTVCSMERALNTLKMDKDMKVVLNKINSMEMAFSTKTIQ